MKNYSLPQNDKSQERKTQLETVRAQYAYNNDYGIPVSTVVQENDKAGPIWTLKVLKTLYKARTNLEAIVQRGGYQVSTPIPHSSPIEIANHLRKKDMTALFRYYLPEVGTIKNADNPSIDDYRSVFQKVQKTYATDIFMDDSYFVHSFLAGPNPNMFQKVSSLPKNFGLTAEIFQASVSGDNLSQALASGRIFLANYAALSALSPGVHPTGRQKYIYQPIVAFVRSLNTSELQPVAIQCGQDSAAFPVYTPRDQWAWQMAKGTAWVAHYCYQEMLTHLAFTHLLIEPIVVATRRQLHESHPVHALLFPHFEGTLPINSLAISRLIQPGQAVDRLVGSEKNSNYALIASQRLAYSFSGNYLPKRMESMGVASSKDIPVYHYRDDGLPLWKAIKDWVSAYVDVYYSSDATVRADAELQAWAAEISSQAGGKIKDFAANGGVNDKSQLIDTCTMIIFTSGPQHAAVNFPQITDLSFLPGGPLAGYRPAPESAAMTEQDYMNFLPPVDVAIKQWQSLYFLGSVNYSNLGVYPVGHFIDPRIVAANAAFMLQLGKIELEITARNRKRIPYSHLLPSKIPQSINI